MKPRQTSFARLAGRVEPVTFTLRQVMRHRWIAQVMTFVGLLGVLSLTIGASAAAPVVRQTQSSAQLLGAAGNTKTFLPLVTNPGAPSGGLGWAMVAANPQRTSWTPEEVRGPYALDWYHPIEPYIPYKIQPIAANGAIYVSTARGLYAFRASDGSLLWVYPTALPLGNSPTVANINGESIAYVGGYDREIHAIDTATGQDLLGYTPFVAAAGFETNPLVIQDGHTDNAPVVLAGNRDGYFYALDALTGALKWKYPTGGPISFSAAYKDGVLYFASQDMYAYALNAKTGSLVWKSAKLLGQSFTSFWPVIYTDKSSGKDYVSFSGGEDYRASELSLTADETSIFNALFSGGVLPTGIVPGNWALGTTTMDASIITNYYANKPYRRRVFFLDSSNGQEFTFSDPVSGKPTYAPFSWSGTTRGGNKYPGVVNGVDGVYYQQTAYDFGGWVTRGAAVGWKFGTQYVSEVQRLVGNPNDTASDEPTAYASGGKLLYVALCCDRLAAAYDVTIPFGQPNRAWSILAYLGSNNQLPGYQQMYDDGNSSLYNSQVGWQIYSGNNQSKNGVYGKHVTGQAPPIPYQGKLYVIKGNSLIAFSPTGTSPKTPLALAKVVATQSVPVSPSRTELQQRLASEVQKMIIAGPLRPGYNPAGQYEQYGVGHYTDHREMGEIFDYFSNPADTVYTLWLAYPNLSPALQVAAKVYLQTYYGPGATYDFTKIVHVGWGTGAAREWADTPPDWLSFDGSPGSHSYDSPLIPSTKPNCGACGYWQYFPPFNFYAAWKYAQVVGNNVPAFAEILFTSMSGRIEAPAADSFLLARPYFINEYAAGYLGFLQLKQLAGLGGDTTVQGYYNHMLSLRVNNFSKDSAYWNTGYTYDGPGVDDMRNLSVASNFMFLTPEIAAYMNQHIQSQVQTAIDEYNYVAPYWFVAGFDGAAKESSHAPLYDYPALFQAKAYILKQPYMELVKYLDVPALKQGDLFYIQNLVAALSAN
jgi:PQQ-like domain